MVTKVNGRRIGDDVLTVLSGCRVDGQVVYLPPKQLERKLYERVNDVLVALGGKWNRKQKGHVFEDEPAGRLEDAILTASYERPQDLGFFPTPAPIVEILMRAADVQKDMQCLEPSAGDGAIADELAKIVGPKNVAVMEIQDKKREALKEKGYDVLGSDFLTVPQKYFFDRIVMNPPFSKQADIDHVLHAFRFLRRGGRLVSVMSASVVFRENRKTLEFREFVEEKGRIEALPDGAFKDSGTDVRTVMVMLEGPGLRKDS